MKRWWAGLIAASALGWGATTTTWEMNGYGDFLRGRMEGLTLTRDGRLTLGPKLDTLFAPDQAEIWSMARAADGSLYLGTGHRGRLYKLDQNGKSTLLWTADQPEIFAVAVDSKGVVYAGTSPDGKVYRITFDGSGGAKASEYFAPGARFIWALAAAPDGALYVATGDQGKVFRVTPDGDAGKGEVYYETGQANVTSLLLDGQGRLLAGSEPNGILYRITAPQKAFVLYHAALPEIRGLAVAPDGSIYAAALGGGTAKRAAAANSASNAGAALPVVTTSITVTDQADQQAGVVPPKPEASKAPVPQTPATSSSSTSTVEYAGGDKSAVYRINPDNTVESLWSSKDENVYDLAVNGGSVVFLTDVDGRIYRMGADRQAALIAQTGEGDATRLMETPAGLLAATGSLAKIVRLSKSAGPGGWFEAPVHDAGAVARWGRITWRGAAKGVTVRTRSGNSARPDATWSDWSEPIAASGGTPIASPNARYIQWRAEFSGAGGALPSIENVTVAYLPQNTPPVVRSISVTATPAVPRAAATASTAAAYSVTVTDSGEAPAAAGTASQTISRAAGQQLQIVWQADDPEGDRLLYSLYFRGEDESQWKLLRADTLDNTFALDGDQLADGRYYFRVTASDRPSNPAVYARQSELVSSPVLIDNTPPAVTATLARTGAGAEITVDAEDRATALRRCEYSVDAGPWLPVEATDGITDSPRERFIVRLDALPAGEHLVVIRVFDTAGNAGLAKVVVR